MSLAQARLALLAGNFAIGCGVMVVPGSLNSLVESLQVSVAVAGQQVYTAANDGTLRRWSLATPQQSLWDIGASATSAASSAFAASRFMKFRKAAPATPQRAWPRKRRPSPRYSRKNTGWWRWTRMPPT